MSVSSSSPVTGKIYSLPNSTGSDKCNIDNFLSGNPGKSVVVVQGLGFVGSVMSMVCANANAGSYAVIGVDLPTEQTYWKICSLNEGTLPLRSADPKVLQYYEKAKEQGNFLATFDPIAYSHADVVIVDINLDVQKESDDEGKLIDYDVTLEPFKKGIEAISKNCKPNVLVLIETTVPPGTCEKIVLPILEKGFADRNLSTDMLKVGHSYERVMPGPNYIDSIENFYRVYSGVNHESEVATENFLKTIIRTDKFPLTKLNNTNATEMAKVLENSYRAMNIAFIVEWSRFAEKAGVDLYGVINAIKMRETHSNMMYPNIGVGGYCLPKDPLLASWANKNLFNADKALVQSENGVRINDQMPFFAYNFFKNNVIKIGRKMKGLKVLLLGVSYRGDVGDTRYSPVELFCKSLFSEGCEVRAHDYFVDYWTECDLKVENDLKLALEWDFDAIAVTTGHSEYRNNSLVLEKLKGCSSRIIVDTIGLLSEIELSEIGKNHHRFVLGRGDLSNP